MGREAETRGAGEILFTSMDHDGTKGFANNALAELTETLNIPIMLPVERAIVSILWMLSQKEELMLRLLPVFFTLVRLNYRNKRILNEKIFQQEPSYENSEF